MKKLSILFAALMACTLSFAGTVTFDATADKASDATTLTKDGITLTISGGTLANGSEYRIYQGQTLKVTSTVGNMTSIELTCTANGTAKYGPGNMTGDGYTAGTAKVGTWTGDADNITLKASSAQVRATKIVITYTDANPDAVAKPTFTPIVSDFIGSVEVALAAGEGLDIYYTLDGTEPTTASTKYTAPFTLTATTTVKAIAYNATTSKASEVAEQTYTAQTLMTCAEANAAADGDFIALDEVTVAYVNGANTYVKDATGYALIYAFNFGLEAGQVVKGLQGNMKIFNNLPEIVPSVAKADLTITTGTAPEPDMLTTVPTMADINKYVRIENVTTIAATWSKNDSQTAARTLVGKLGENDITLYNTFKIDQTFEAANYDIVGVVTCYKTTIQIAVISAEKVEEPTPTPAYCQTEVGHLLADNAAPDSYVLLSIGSKNGKTIVRIDQDTEKNTMMFDYLQVTGLATAGGDITEGGEKAMAVEFDTPAADEEGNITLEILWSTVNWEGRWMVQNIKLSATAECEHAVLVGPGSAINNATLKNNIVKRIENGVLIIEKDGIRYNAQGAKLN